MMEIYAGTSGFSFKEWVGSFYPDKLPANAMLAHYATQLPAVEINNTFYRMPKKTMLEGWCDKVPATFRFAIKASRRITHSKKLLDAGEEVAYLLGNLEVLDERLGAVLFQLPPFLRKDRARLADFVGALPAGLPAAFEFRHDSWFDDEIADLLAQRNLPWVLSETDLNTVPERLATANWGYLRLRRSEYSDDELEQWYARIADLGWSHALVFFKHEDDCVGPALAQRFIDIGRHVAG